MKLNKNFFLGMAAFLLIFTAVTVGAQTAAGRIVGSVTDPQGAVIPGARVTAINTATGVKTSSLSNSVGYFEVPNLPIGDYAVNAEHKGFKITVTPPATLHINESLRLDITMTVGAVSETVTVNAGATGGVETVNPTISDTVNGQAIQDLPLNGRNVLDLAKLQPGVTEADPDAGGNGYSISGGRTDATTFLLDGGLNTDLLRNTVVFNPNPDSIAEFSILKSNYTAEYGRNGGGIISVVTKSGTDQLHGSGYDYVRNTVLDANNFFSNLAGLPRNTLVRNQFGATLGGPITIPHVVNGKDKLFFFVAYQGQRQSQTETETQIPTFTPAELNGDFSQSLNLGNQDSKAAVIAFLQSPAGQQFQPNPTLAAQGIINPLSINPVAQAYIAANLIPTSSTGILNSAEVSTNNQNELTSKIDWNISPKDRLAITLGGNRANQLLPYGDGQSTAPGYDDTTVSNQYYMNADYIRTITTTMLDEARMTVQRSYSLSDTPVKSLPGPQALGVQINPDLSYGPPTINFDSGLGIGFSQNGPTVFPDTTWGYTDTFSWTKGKHGLKFGAGYTAYDDNFQYAYATVGGFYFGSTEAASTGAEFADFLVGNPYSFVQGPNGPNNIRSKATYFFGQDEWRVTPSLTVTIGLRYEYNTPKLDTKGRTDDILIGVQSTRYAAAPTGIVFPGDKGAPVGLYFPDKNNFAPRLGFAWMPTKSGKISVRGGVGVFYDVINGRDNIDTNGAAPFASYSNPYYGSQANFTVATPFQDPYGAAGIPNPFPTPKASQITNWIAQLGPFNATSDDPNIRTPYIFQYNLSAQEEVARNLIATFSYVGSSSRKLISVRQFNPMILGTQNRILNQNQTNPTILSECSLINPANEECPFAGSTGGYTNGGNSEYNSLQSSLTKQTGDTRLGRTYFTLAYTLGHSIDNESGRANRSQTVPVYQPNAFRASSDFDVRQTISFSGGWDLPFDKTWANGPTRLTKGWTLNPILSWRTGFPFTVNANYPSTGDNDPGSSGAGDPSYTNALFAPGFSSVKIQSVSVKNLTYFNPATFTNAQFVSLWDDPVNGVPCNQQSNINEFPSRDCILSTPSLRTYGSPRNLFRGPGRTNLDFSIAKSTRIYDKMEAVFRLDAFNIFNHTEFSYVNTSIASNIFGQVNAAYDPRILQLVARFTF